MPFKNIDLTEIVKQCVKNIKDAEQVKKIVEASMILNMPKENKIAILKVVDEKTNIIIKNKMILKISDVLTQVDALADYGRHVSDIDLYDKMAKIGDGLAIMMEEKYNDISTK